MGSNTNTVEKLWPDRETEGRRRLPGDRGMRAANAPLNAVLTLSFAADLIAEHLHLVIEFLGAARDRMEQETDRDRHHAPQSQSDGEDRGRELADRPDTKRRHERSQNQDQA